MSMDMRRILHSFSHLANRSAVRFAFSFLHAQYHFDIVVSFDKEIWAQIVSK